MGDGFISYDLDRLPGKAAYRRDIDRLNQAVAKLFRSLGRKDLIELGQSLSREHAELDPKCLLERAPMLNNARTVRDLLRALTLSAQLLNVAQQKEIVRATRARSADGNASPRPESILDAVHSLKERGVTAREIQTLLDSVEVRPTLTAHPTEARRRSILEKLYLITESLASWDADSETVRLDRPVNDHDWPERDLMATLNSLWQTDELRPHALVVEDEVKNALYFFDRTIMPAVSWVHDSLRLALDREYPGEDFRLPSAVRYHSWVGGDRDGNPNVSPDATWKALVMHKRVALAHYRKRVVRLQRFLTQSLRLVEPSEDLLASIERELEESRLSTAQRSRFSKEPYRLKLALILEKLDGAIRELDSQSSWRTPQTPLGDERPAYLSAQEMLADLSLVQASLKRHAAGVLAEEGRMAMLAVQVRAFGFHLAHLDMRQHSQEHEFAVSELLAAGGALPDSESYPALSERDRCDLLGRELSTPRPLSPLGFSFSERTANVLDVFRVMRQAMDRLSPESVGTYVVSMTHGTSDLLEVLLLAKEAGLLDLAHAQPASRIDVVPLFETIDDLSKCGELLKRTLEHSVYARQIQARSRFQEIMLGYSDSTKDGGFLAANCALFEAHSKVSEACRDCDVSFRIFEGRGGAIGRGGGRANHAILAQPPGSINGRIRFTEQGEVISFRYGLAPYAHRHLEQMLHAVLLSSFKSASVGGERVGEWEIALADLAGVSYEAYRILVHDDPEFWEFYVEATPIEHISKLPIASRPVYRPGAQIDGVDSLRAIPWVFSWTQSRYGLPGWFGLGSALEQYASRSEGLDTLQRMYASWPIFRLIIENAQSDLLRGDPRVAEWYADLVERRDLATRIHESIELERSRTIQWISRVTQREQLGVEFERSGMAFRKPLLDSLSLLQVYLLSKWKSGSDPSDVELWNEAILLSMAGLAAGLQSTG